MKLSPILCALTATWTIGCAADFDGTEVLLEDKGNSSFAYKTHQKLCATAMPHAAGTTEHFIESGGIERRFLLHVPPSYDGTTALSLVLDLHGSTSFPEQEMVISGMAEVADAEGFAVAFPAGIDRFWNVPVDPAKQDDVQFLSDLIDAVDATLCLDQDRVYATGFSGGGRMISQLACDLSERIAAIAPVGGLRFPTPCDSTRRLPVITFHGTADPVNPYDGGGPAYWGASVPEVADGWAQHNNCTSVKEKPYSPSITKIEYEGDGCEDVIVYRIDGMGHQWPGSSLDTGLGAPPTYEMSASQVMWDFFEKHHL